MQFESATADAGGRITTRTVAGRDYYYNYDAAGRLVDYTDTQNSDNDALYTYDQWGRRIYMTIGTTNIRMVYQGADVVAEYTDYDDDDVADKKRIYWILPRIDQRIGFVDYDEEGDPSLYYYLTDQVGSVIQIVDEAGVVVNQYDYDAFGNIHWENSFEGVENRYRFQGREWDEHRQEYYFRMRTYVPEWGQFTGPDMDIRLEGEGIMNYLFALNSPLQYTDPTGLCLFAGFASEGTEKLVDVVADSVSQRLNNAGFTGLGATVAVLGEVAKAPLRIYKSVDPVYRTVKTYQNYRGYRNEGLSSPSSYAGALVQSMPVIPSVIELSEGHSFHSADMGKKLDGLDKSVRWCDVVAGASWLTAYGLGKAGINPNLFGKTPGSGVQGGIIRSLEGHVPDAAKWVRRGGSVTYHPDGAITYALKGKSITYNQLGYPDFSPHMYNARQGASQVRIRLTGSRVLDEAAANAAAGLKKTPRGYTWHHHQDVGLMQLVEASYHRQFWHKGGFSSGDQ